MQDITVEPVADGIYRLRLPLPFALDHVNCYLLRGQEGWTIVDTGLNTSAARAGWEKAFAALSIRPEDVAQIVLTHVHPDHYGLAGWLQQWTGGRAPVRMSASTVQAAQHLWQAPAEAWRSETVAYLRRNGLPLDRLESVLENMAFLRARVQPLPERIEILEAGCTLTMDNRHMRVLAARGHADDQVLFYDAVDRLLICGDQVLMRITPNIGTWPGASPNPLARFLADLGTLRALDVRVALPGHRRVIHDFAARIDELLHHHDRRLQATRDAIPPEGATTLAVARGVFPFENYTTHELRFAVAETLAHLEYLLAEGRIRRETDGNGVWRFLRT